MRLANEQNSNSSFSPKKVPTSVKLPSTYCESVSSTQLKITTDNLRKPPDIKLYI